MNGINEMQITHHTDQQVEKTNVPRFLQTMKALAPRSYEKAFKGMDEQVVIFAMSKAINGLSKQQLQIGLDAMFEQGYCPDPIMFRKWCLGIKGFTSDVDPIHASYRAKNAAIANIEAWMIDDTTKITNAEREAYNRCYGMFNDLKLNYSDKQKFHTYLAFKDFYDEVVKELVLNGTIQCVWEAPKMIDSNPLYAPVDRIHKSNSSAKINGSEKIANRIADLVSEGMTVAEASRQVMSESIKRISK